MSSTEGVIRQLNNQLVDSSRVVTQRDHEQALRREGERGEGGREVRRAGGKERGKKGPRRREFEASETGRACEGRFGPFDQVRGRRFRYFTLLYFTP